MYGELMNPAFQRKYLKGHTEGNPRKDGKMMYGTTLLDFTGPQVHWMMLWTYQTGGV
jgi:hypothetical protein